MKVFLHTKKRGDSRWIDTSCDLMRLPRVGEFIALEFNAPWFMVEGIVDNSNVPDYAAEIFAVEVKYTEAQKEVMKEII